MRLKFPNTIDRFIIKRMISVTVLMLLLLVFIFIIIDFSENSDDFSDRGATAAEIWGNYYIHYIAEIIRLVAPVSLFVAALLISGQLADRVEFIALKAAGVSLYRISLPFIFVGIIAMTFVSYLDGYVVPYSNRERIKFERTYINRKSDRLDKSKLLRQTSPNSIIQINYFEPSSKIGYRISMLDYNADSLIRQTEVARMQYIDTLEVWRLFDITFRKFESERVIEITQTQKDTVLTIFPRDLSRTSADIFQLTYPEILEYLESVERSGAGGIELPTVQFYSKLSYPISIPIVIIIGLCLASVRRKGGKGVYLAIGLGVSFIYLTTMKLFEPLGINGVLSPLHAAIIPHLIFFFASVVLMIKTKK